MRLGRRELAGFTLTAGMGLTVATSAGANAEEYPNRPITLVVGSPQGGGADLIARRVALYMTEDLGQKVVIQNRAGGAGNAGVVFEDKAEPDGYTVYLAARPAALHKMMCRDVGYDFFKDLVPVAMVAGVPCVLVVDKRVPALTMDQAVAMARMDPWRFTCDAGGLGPKSMVLPERLKGKDATSWIAIPYMADAPSLLDVVGGRTAYSVTTLAAALPYIRSGTVRALAVLSDAQVPVVSAMPNIEEYVTLDFSAQGWYAVVAPAGTPPYAITRLNRAINAAISSAEVRKPLTDLGYVVPSSSNTPEGLAQFMEEDVRKWTAILEARRVKGIQ